MQKYSRIPKLIKEAHSELGWYELFHEFSHLRTFSSKPINVSTNSQPYYSGHSYKKDMKHHGYCMIFSRVNYKYLSEGQKFNGDIWKRNRFIWSSGTVFKGKFHNKSREKGVQIERSGVFI